ncbi:MAG TPA: large-conductance mechanosensitive channel protein MscL [Polyangiaceae bacterium]|jgi:large conductance mechanosensitive channel|nr:large-conductance mechanosensitive channel protein MscL [Polyangiaceae bacterium]
MSILSDFKAFAMKGNVVDMAVGVVIGNAFGKIVASLVGDIITPVLGVLIGGVDFKDMKLMLREKTETSPEVAWTYGAFIQSIFDFLIISISIFTVIRLLSMLQRKKAEAPAPPAPPPQEVVLLTEIRDALKARS